MSMLLYDCYILLCFRGKYGEINSKFDNVFEFNEFDINNGDYSIRHTHRVILYGHTAQTLA